MSCYKLAFTHMLCLITYAQWLLTSALSEHLLSAITKPHKNALFKSHELQHVNQQAIAINIMLRCTLHLHWGPGIILWKLVNLTLDCVMAPPYVHCGLEVNIFEQHWKSDPNLWEFDWEIHHRRAAFGT